MKYYVLMLLAMLVPFLNDLNHDITWKKQKDLTELTAAPHYIEGTHKKGRNYI